MRIGIDLRMAGTGEGIGRYVEELVRNLSRVDFENEYFLITSSPNSKFLIDLISNKNFKFQIVKVSSQYYSFAEQTRFIWELKRLKLDLVHFPNFNHPIFYPGKFAVTIHDMIHHQFPGKKKSHYIHRLAYRLVFSHAVKKSEIIIAVSQATKKELLKHYAVQNEKIKVIHEGVDDGFFSEAGEGRKNQVKQKYGITKPYLLFVGVWRQYKNLPRLGRAFDILKEQYGWDGQLVLAGRIDPFYPEIRRQVLGLKSQADILPLGYVPDDDLIPLYQGAEIFVLPSLTEGFGLIGAEAQAAGAPVAASDIPVLREVLGKGAAYFDPEDEKDMAAALNKILSDEDLRNRIVEQGLANAKKYNWESAARETLQVYKNINL